MTREELVELAARLGTERDRLRAALVYVCFAQHRTPQYMLPDGITLIDGHSVEVTVNMPEFGKVTVTAGPNFSHSAGLKDG